MPNSNSNQKARLLMTRCAATLVVSFHLWGGFARADFDTIINSPPAEFEPYGTIGSNTQVNLYSGGVLPAYYTIGPYWESGDNIEINLLGGSIGEALRYSTWKTSSRNSTTTNVVVNLIQGDVWGSIAGTSASAITLSGATVYDQLSSDNGTLDLLAGEVGGGVRGTTGALLILSGATVGGDFEVRDGSLATVTGGRVTGVLSARDGSMVRMSGGTVGRGYGPFSDGATVRDGSVFLMSGGEIDGAFAVSNSFASVTGGRITGQVAVSPASQIDISGGSLGPLRVYAGGNATLIGEDFQLDGVPIDGLGSSSQPINFPENSIITGVLSDGTPVILANIEYWHDYFANGQVNLSLAPVPTHEPRHFDSGTDAIPAGLRNGQSLTLRPGTSIPPNFTVLPGSSVSIVGGEIGHGFEAAGASIIMSAGRIGELSTIYEGTTLRMSGGNVESNFEVAAGARLEISGGAVRELLVAHPGSEVLYSGGKLSGLVGTESGSSFTIAGGNFKINGAFVPGLASPGATQQVDLPDYGVLSGTLSDGTSFAFNSGYDWLAPGTLTLRTTDVPSAGPSIIRVPSDPVPSGLRSEQTLILSDGGDLGDNFTADWGSIVQMTGGRIGHRFETVGSFVNVTGGEIGSLDALLGSVINLNGGTIDHHASVGRGAILNVAGGGVTGSIDVKDGGRVNLTGGASANYINAYAGGFLNMQSGTVLGGIALHQGGVLTVEGGEIQGGINVWSGSHLGLSGGRLGDNLNISDGALATLSGASFRIDGEPLGSGSLNEVIPVDLPPGAVLSGILNDGTPFAFTSTDGDYLHPGALKVASGRFLSILNNITWPFSTLPKGLRPGAELTLESGESVGANFTAGWESRLTVDGGEVGDNFEAVGAEVRLLAGAIGEDMDVLYGSELTITGGTIGEGLQAHRGSIVNISGGAVPEIEARAGSQVNITGGTFGRYANSDYQSGHIAMEAGSGLEVVGDNFIINGTPVEGLQPGESLILDWEGQSHGYLSLSAQLADGSPFSAWFSSDLYPHPSSGQIDGSPIVTLKMVAASAQVPEPSSLALAISLLVVRVRRRTIVRG